LAPTLSNFAKSDLTDALSRTRGGTSQIWEKEYGLSIYRRGTGTRVPVFAFVSEIDERYRRKETLTPKR